MKKLILKLLSISPFIFISVILLILTKGLLGSGLKQGQQLMNQGEAFESTISRGRYALVLSIVEEGAWNLSPATADFGAPDVSVYKNKYVSIFPPGVSLFLVPFYITGRTFNFGQLATALAVVIVTLANTILIYFIGKRLGLNKQVSALCSVLFAFATNALAYSTIISQHQITTFIILFEILLLTTKRSILKHILFWIFYGVSVLVDWPNVILLFPAALYLLFTDILNVKLEVRKIRIKLWFLYGAFLIIIIAPVFFYGYYNLITTGSPYKFGQILTRYKGTSAPQILPSKSEKTANVAKVFDIGKMPQGLSVLVFSKERGLLYFAPILTLAILGIAELYKKKKGIAYVLITIPTINLLLYSMFGDVWGGWAFGPRYLIPTFSIMTLFLGVALKKYFNNLLFITLFLVLMVISVATNSLGAVSTTLIPPIHEAIGLGLDPNINYPLIHLQTKPLGSFVYNQFLSRYLNPIGFYYLIFILSVSLTLALFVLSLRSLKKNAGN